MGPGGYNRDRHVSKYRGICQSPPYCRHCPELSWKSGLTEYNHTDICLYSRYYYSTGTVLSLYPIFQVQARSKLNTAIKNQALKLSKMGHLGGSVD